MMARGSKSALLASLSHRERVPARSAIITRSFRDGAISAFTRVFDALWRRTRNPETFSVCGSGFRVRSLCSRPGMTNVFAPLPNGEREHL